MPGQPNRLRLGVNIDHVATLRNARGGSHPDPLRAAKLAMQAGADGITAHLREDRRHITDRDLEALVAAKLPVNMEMAATEEMLEVALKQRPAACCLVPERREERTTEGGLDVAGNIDRLRPIVAALAKAGIPTSLFIEPHTHQWNAVRAAGAHIIELHTGAYCEAAQAGNSAEVSRHLELLRQAALGAASAGIEVHAGHGLGFDNVAAVAAIPEITELQIGHFLIGEAVFTGLENAIRRIREVMDGAR
jgi:pyridoxine 5-phosphate synthase